MVCGLWSVVWSVVCLTLSSIRYTVQLVYLASAAKAGNFPLQAPPTTHHCFPSYPSLPLDLHLGWIRSAPLGGSMGDFGFQGRRWRWLDSLDSPRTDRGSIAALKPGAGQADSLGLGLRQRQKTLREAD